MAIVRAVLCLGLLVCGSDALGLRKASLRSRQNQDPAPEAEEDKPFKLTERGSFGFDCYGGAHGDEKGKDYKGLHDSTKSGRKCANWLDKKQSPADPGIGNHNFCRNPDGSDQPWCFTVDPTMEKEDCAVPKCPEGGMEPKEWVSPKGAKSEENAEPCVYEPPEPEPKVWKEGVACMDHKGDKWWLIGMKKLKAGDATSCMEDCAKKAGTEYYTLLSTPDDDGNDCGCYRSCVPVPEDLTVGGPTTYRM